MMVTQTIAAFALAWNVAGDQERMRLLSSSCLPDALFVARQGPAAGTEALSASIGEFRRAYPAAVVTFGEPDEHGGYARVAWTTHWHDGRPPLTGVDFAQLARDGRISVLVSFDGDCQPAS
jgi:hypothetical protein